MVISLGMWPPANADPATNESAAVAKIVFLDNIAFSHATRFSMIEFA
jgi:hypothetical protein